MDDLQRTRLSTFLRGLAGLFTGILAGAVTLIVLIVAFESVRGSGQTTIVVSDGKRRPVEEAPGRHILRGSGEIVVQSCRGACDQFQL